MTYYPADHFPGTPAKAKCWVASAMEFVQDAGFDFTAGPGVNPGNDADWQIGLEIIGRYESNWNPKAINPNATNGTARGLTQQFAEWVKITYKHGLAPTPNWADPVSNLCMAIIHISSYGPCLLGGYSGMGSPTDPLWNLSNYSCSHRFGLMSCDTLGPGNVAVKWHDNPGYSYEQLRPEYRGQ